MEGYHQFRNTERREFRIKHPCRCYYVVWRASGATNAFGWHFCSAHGDEYRRFQDGARPARFPSAKS
jgi:hypothetical protein